MFKSILVLESPWDSDSVQSKSVWPFVSEFAKAMDLRAFHQSFSDKDSFCHWIERFNEEQVPSDKLLYVAAHGSDKRISGLRKTINGTTIISTLKKSKNIRHVHFGSCFYGNEGNLKSLLKQVKHIHWVAGYEKSVDWVESTLFDVLLWRRLATHDDRTKGLRSQTLAQDLIKEIPGLAKNLGFRFQYRLGKNTHGL